MLRKALVLPGRVLPGAHHSEHRPLMERCVPRPWEAGAVDARRRRLSFVNALEGAW